MRTSVIISTFDKPEYLCRTLAGLAHQVVLPDELLIADDGSGEETRDLIRAFRATAPFPVVHVRQEHIGWRKCRIMNACLRESRGDYLIFSDGDCVHRWDWVRAHIRMARPGRFLGGGDLRLNAAVSHRITAEDVASRRAFSPWWLMRNGMKWRRSMVKILLPRFLAPVTDAINFTATRFGGSNASCWREDALRVGGFDERFGWGKEDAELGFRLRHSGLSSRHVRYNAICLHLDHPRDTTITRETVDRNFAMLAQVRAERRIRAELGIEQTGNDHVVERENPAAVLVQQTRVAQTASTPATEVEPPGVAV